MKYNKNKDPEDDEATLEMLIGRDPGLDYLDPRPLDTKPPTDPEIPIISGTAEDVPKDIVYSEYFLEKKPDGFDICHYFDAGEHVYSICHNKRRRAKFEQVKEVHPTPSRKVQYTQTQIEEVYNNYIVPTLDRKKVEFQCTRVADFIHDKYDCMVTNITQGNGTFPHVSISELQKARISSHGGMPMKDVVWLASGQEIPDGLDVYPLCCNPACLKLDHLYLATKRDWLIRRGCAGTVVSTVTEWNASRYTECSCTIKCKKTYLHTFREKPITPKHRCLPYHIPERRLPRQETFDRKSNIVAMRFKVEEAKDLLRLCDKWIDVRHELDCMSEPKMADQKEMKERITAWRMCRKLSDENTTVFRNKSGSDLEHAYLKIPEDHNLHGIATKVKVKHLIWRAHGHNIRAGRNIYNTCLDSNCERYEHLSEESHDTFLSRQTCRNVLCLVDDVLNTVLPCRHTIKCTGIQTVSK